MDGKREADPVPPAVTPESAVPAASPVPAAPARSRWQRREQAAADALRSFVRDYHETRFGVVAPRTPSVELHLRLRVEPGQAWALAFDPPLAEQLQPQLEAAHAHLAVYSEGRMFCHKCESVSCAHTAPPTPASVFAGYDPMGLPEWKEFSQVLIERKDERVGDLYTPRAPLLACVQMGHDLRERQLGTFGRGSKSYSVLGQVVAGYLLVRTGSGAEAQERCAFTFQVVEGRDEANRTTLNLNTLAALPASLGLDELLASDAASWVGRARSAAVREIRQIERLVRESPVPDQRRRAFGRVPAVLRRLAELLERGRRQEDRRTRHARARQEDRRPVHKALEDLAAARPDAVFFDEKPDTLVVCGAQGRAHVFSRAGRHVTSFSLPPGGAEFRVSTRRWTPATAADVDALKERAAHPSADRPEGPETAASAPAD